MKTATFTLAAFVGLAAAQSLGDIPSCASQCGQDMLSNQGSEEIDGCSANDVGCLCQSPMFIMGLRDCATATCGAEDAQSVVQAGVELCRNAGVEITDAPSTATDGGASGSGSNTASPTPTSTGGNGGGAGGLVSTITSDGSTMVTTLSSSSGDIGDSISDALSSGVGSLTSGFNSITSALGSATSSLGSMTSDMDSASSTSEGGDSTSTGGGDGDDATGSDGSATSTDGEDAAPMATAAPVGLFAAAGIAALVL